ncbi:hypothetical protein [Pseudarthrobacter albicanus]|uniref:hypothetical protein n=1 Tax=Pseudarthrobacter albicanus TaxID=2823873 RepID=UPI001FEAE48E|nr:hypothetical protein [Pseudarthrobacter albicanus]
MKRGFTSKREAELFLASVEVSKARGEYIEHAQSRSTVGLLGTAWLARQTHLKPPSLRPVEAAWRNHVEPVWGGTAVADIRKSAVQQWASDLTSGSDAESRKPKSATVVIRAFGVLASILDEAVDDRRILTNPARGVNLPRKVKRQHIYLSHEEVHRLADESKYPTLILILAYCGIRWG